MLICNAFFELLVGPVHDLAISAGNFTEQLQRVKSILSLKKLPDCSKFSDAQSSELHKAYLSNGIWAVFNRLLTVVGVLLNDDIEFLRNELLDSLGQFIAKGPENLVLPVLRLVLLKITSNDQRVFDKAAKIVDISINNKHTLSLALVKEVHHILLNKSLKQDAKTQCFMVLSNIKFEVVEDQEVMHYSLKVFIDELRIFIEDFLDKKYSKNQLLKRKFDANHKTKNKNRRVPTTTLLNEHMEHSAKLLNQVFKGINKILPRIKANPALNIFLETHLEKFFRFCHLTNSKLSIQILLFLYQVLKHDLYSSLAERYLTMLYGFLNHPSVFHSRLLEQFFDLIYTIVTTDHSSERVCAIFKRILINVLHCDSRVIVACLVFFAKVVREKPVLGILLQNKLTTVSTLTISNEEEIYKDAELSDGETQKKTIVALVPTTAVSFGYLSEKRNPLYSGAEKSALHEILYLRTHYNPTVRKLAYLISNGEFDKIDYKGNPFEDFTNVAILTRLSLNAQRKKPETKRNAQKQAGRKLKLDPVSLENYKSLQFEDERAIQMYFEKKVDAFKIEIGKKEKQKPVDFDEEDEADQFADEIFEKEMNKLGGGDNDDMSYDQNDNQNDQDEEDQNDEDQDDEQDDQEDDGENQDDQDDDGENQNEEEEEPTQKKRGFSGRRESHNRQKKVKRN